MLNSVKRRKKRSRLRVKMNIYVGVSGFIQLVLCLFAAFYHCINLLVFKKDYKDFINYDELNIPLIFLIRLGNWMVILA